jgi:thiosulfate/3-mercaptopyruvate sulfurtransferase
MAQLEKDHAPVDPAWLHDRLGEASLPASSGESLLIVEVGWQHEENYRAGHIPGAIYLDTNLFERAPSWNVLPAPELEQVLLSHGLTSGQTTVLYGRDPLAVARTALVLLYAGVEQVLWLDGGIEGWKAGGYKLETGSRTPVTARSLGCRLPAHPKYIADISQVRLGLIDPNTVIACVRTWEEYTGQTSGYEYIQPRGRIPGSVWAGEPGFEERHYRPGHPLGQSRRRCREIAGLWRSRGVTPDKRVIFYCGTGWRASEAFLYAWLMGWKDIAVYDGGWLEWSTDLSNPIEV